MTLNARQLTNNDTTDIGYDLVLDNIAALSGDVGVTKLMIGVAGTNGGLVAATVPLPIGANTVKDGSGTVYAPLVDADAHLQVDVLSSASHAVTNAGTFAVQVDGAALTSLQLLDDAIHTEAAALSKAVLICLDDGTDSQFAQANASGHLKIDIATDSVGIGGGTQYAVDTALGATPTGRLAIAIRDDALSALVPIEGDAIGLRVDANGALWVIPSGTVTVGGTVTANLGTIGGAATQTTLAAIDTKLGGTLTVGSHAVTNAGTFAVQAAQSGTWTVQPGNTANTTAWLVTGTGGTFPVTGTFWQATQPVSAVSLPLPTGAATAAKQPALGTAGVPSIDVISVQGVAAGTVIPVSGTFWQATQPVSLASVPSHAVTNAGTFAVQVDGSALTALQLIDDIIHSGDAVLAKYAVIGAVLDDTATGAVTENQANALRMSSRRALLVEGVASGTAVAVSGTFWQATQPVSAASLPLPTGAATETTLAAVDTKLGGTLTVGSHAVTNAGTFAVQVDGAALTSLQLIDNIVSVVDGVAGATPTGVAALAVRDDALSALTPLEGDFVSLRTDANGALWVIPSGTVTISGTVTANAGTNLNTSALALEAGGNLAGAATSLAVIDDWDETDRCKVNLIAAQVGITAGAGAVAANSPRVTLASDDPAVTALQILDNIVAGSEAQCDVITQPARAATTDTITAKLATDSLQNGTTALTPKFAFANIAASTTDGALVAAVPTKKLRVLGYQMMAGGTATNVTINSKPAGAGTAISMLHACGANGGISVSFSPVGYFESVAGEGLAVTTGTGSTVGVQVQYVEV